jgi:hypothetical protein
LLPAILYYLYTLLAGLILVAAGYSLSSLAVTLVGRLLGVRLALSVWEKLSFSYLLVVVLVSLPSYLFRAGLGGVALLPTVLSFLLVILGGVGGVLLFMDARKGFSVRSPRPGGLLFIAFSISAFAVLSYLFSLQSADTNYDFYYANFKVVGWALHDGNLSNPLLQYAYDLRGFPAYWLYLSLDGLLGQGVTMFSLSLVGLASLSLVIYRFAKESLGSEVAKGAVIMILASPLTLLYSYRTLDLDLTVYYAVFASFAFLYLGMKETGTPRGRFFFLLAGLAASASLFCDPKGFISLLVIPAALVFFSRSRSLKAAWSVAFFGALAYVVMGPLFAHGSALPSYVLILLSSVALLAVLQYYVVRTSTANADAGEPAHGVRARDCLVLLVGAAPGMTWQVLFGYPQLGSAGTALAALPQAVSSPFSTSGPFAAQTYVQTLAGNLPNLVASFSGVFTFPFLLAPLAVFGVAAFIFWAARQGGPARLLLLYAVLVACSVFAFAQGNAGSDNWRYFYLFVPFSAISISWGIRILIGERHVATASALVASLFFFTLPSTAVRLVGVTVWFSDGVNLLKSWAFPTVWWVGGALLLATLLALGRRRVPASVTSETAPLRRSKFLLVSSVIICLLLVSVPFASTVLSTWLQDATAVKQDKGFGWDGGLQAPFEYISQNREDFGGRAFLSLYAYGIEYYAGVPSLDLSQRYQVVALVPYLNDSTALRSFLLDQGIAFLLMPTSTNSIRSYVSAAGAWENETAVGGLISGSSVVKSWGDWVLYNLTRG